MFHNFHYKKEEEMKETELSKNIIYKKENEKYKKKLKK